MESNIADLTWEPLIYPREGKNEKTVKAYVEALTIGAQFPPIKIQRVFNYPTENEKIEATLILDGIHRWFAFKECGLKKIRAIEWKKTPPISSFSRGEYEKFFEGFFLWAHQNVKDTTRTAAISGFPLPDQVEDRLRGNDGRYKVKKNLSRLVILYSQKLFKNSRMSRIRVASETSRILPIRTNLPCLGLPKALPFLVNYATCMVTSRNLYNYMKSRRL